MATLRASVLIEIEDAEVIVLLSGAYVPEEHRFIHSASERPNDPEEVEWSIVSVAPVDGGNSEPCPSFLERLLAQSASFDEKACDAIREEHFRRQDEAMERRAEMRREDIAMEKIHG